MTERRYYKNRSDRPPLGRWAGWHSFKKMFRWGPPILSSHPLEYFMRKPPYRKGHPFWSPRLQLRAVYWMAFWTVVILLVDFCVTGTNSDIRLIDFFRTWLAPDRNFLPTDPGGVTYIIEISEISFDGRWVAPAFFFYFLPPWCFVIWHYSKREYWRPMSEQYHKYH